MPPIYCTPGCGRVRGCGRGRGCGQVDQAHGPGRLAS